MDARKAGARCACGALIWAIGSDEIGAASFTCITGEARPDADYEIDEALGPQLSSESIQERADCLKGTIELFGTGNWNPHVILSSLRIAVDEADPFGAPHFPTRGQPLPTARSKPGRSASPSQSPVAAAPTTCAHLAWLDVTDVITTDIGRRRDAVVVFSTVSMKRLNRLPPRKTSRSPPSSTPAKSDFLNVSTESERRRHGFGSQHPTNRLNNEIDEVLGRSRCV